MKASDILALLPIKPEAMPKIATSTQEPTRLTLKQFQECIQDQAMAITSATRPRPQRRKLQLHHQWN